MSRIKLGERLEYVSWESSHINRPSRNLEQNIGIESFKPIINKRYFNKVFLKNN